MYVLLQERRRNEEGEGRKGRVNGGRKVGPGRKEGRSEGRDKGRDEGRGRKVGKKVGRKNGK